jgi:uncharacterized protein
MSAIIDRRPNQGEKNLGNRQRFIRRARDAIKKSIKGNLGNRSIADTDSGERIKIPSDSVSEPTFGQDWTTGEKRRVLPGNKSYVRRDHIPRPDGSGSGGKGSEASNSDETGEDNFSFVLTKDEFYDLFFEDLELPDMIRKQLKTTKSWEIKREGISTAGNPSNLNVIRTMRGSLGRRIVLRRPHERRIAELEALLDSLEPGEKRDAVLAELEQLRSKTKSVSYVDPIDLRYNVFNRKPTNSNAAVMFCLMDVSGSMDENKKELSKRFFMLLYLFLQKKYDSVKLEFIRHHTTAERVDEQTFFYDKLNGGTCVSSALQLCVDVIKKEYDPALYNIYVCQASDGDNYEPDNPECKRVLEEELLPLVQYMAYVEIADKHLHNMYPMMYYSSSRLFNVYQTVANSSEKLQVNKVMEASEIYPVFRKLFEKKTA